MKKVLLFGLVAFLLISLSSIAVADFTTDNQAWYTLNTNLTYGVLDQSPNGNDATNNGATYDATEDAFDFDGVDDTVSSPVDILQSDNSPFAFSIWVNPDSTTGTTVVVSDYDNSPAEGILFEIDDGQIQATRGWDSTTGNFEYGP